MMDDLRPCPFCGGEPIIDDFSTSYRPDSGPLWGVMCNNDDCPVETFAGDEDKAKAIAAWNERAKPLPIDEGLVERVARAIEPLWFTEDGRPPLINNYPGQHEKFQERAREQARAAIEVMLGGRDER